MTSTASASPAFIAIDWGTTNRRGYLVSPDGNIQESVEDDRGILAIEHAGFEDAFENLIERWRHDDGTRLPVLMSGMVGSRQGWIEAPYVLCPARADSIAAAVMPLPIIEEAWIVPGICLNGERRDVMRGEEVQIFGALACAQRVSSTICLPGTHSKWARIDDGLLREFATAMTGEMFQILRTHSILSTLMNTKAAHNTEAFRHGLDMSASSGGLLNHLFSVRADGLFGVIGPDQQSSYLSGLLIGHEIREMTVVCEMTDDPVLIVGAEALTHIYATAFEHLNLTYEIVDGEAAAVKGLAAIWTSLTTG